MIEQFLIKVLGERIFFSLFLIVTTLGSLLAIVAIIRYASGS